MIRKTILSALYYFLFHKNIPITFEVIPLLLLKTNIIFGNFWSIFLSRLIQDINVTFSTEITAITANRNYC